MTDNKVLLFVAHGSNVATSNKRIIDLAGRISIQRNPYVQIIPAFLELASPSMEEAIDKMVKNYSHIDVFPYFLAPGIHYRKDIPKILTKKKQQYPECQFYLLDYFGKLPLLEEVILKYIRN